MSAPANGSRAVKRGEIAHCPPQFVLQLPLSETVRLNAFCGGVVQGFPKGDLKDFVLAVIEESYQYYPDQVAVIDAGLTEKGIISLSSIRIKYTKKYEKIMKIGKINNMNEYSLLKGAVAASLIEDNEEFLKADRMIEEYESKPSGKSSP